MPKGNQCHFLIWLAGSYLAVLDITSWLLRSHPACIVNADNYAAYYGEKDHCPTLHVFVFEHLSHLLKFLGDKDWLIAISAAATAFFTVILAISTIALWKSTRDAARSGAKAAELAERALVGLERPHIFPQITGNNFIIALSKGIPLKERPYLRFEYIYKNTGRAPGIIRRASTWWVTLPYRRLPADTIPNWRGTKGEQSLKVNVLGGDASTEPLTTPFMFAPFSDEEIDQLIGPNKSKMLWLLSVFVYADTLGSHWQASAEYLCFPEINTVRLNTYREEPYPENDLEWLKEA